MTSLSALLLISGFVLLVAGGEAVVRGAASLGKKLGLSSLILGLTVTAFATSSPELAVSLTSVISGSAGLAVGNVVGSNIANVLFVLGLTAVFAALVVRVRLIKVDILVMIGFSALAVLLASDGRFSAVDGAILLGLFLLYLAAILWYARQARDSTEGNCLGVEGVLARGPGGRLAARLRATALGCTTVDIVLLLGGVLLLVSGAKLLVEGASSIAATLGVSELIIGLTVVAIGTSLPELATSVIAAIRGERDMAIGNLIGANIFNITVVLGLSSLLAPRGLRVNSAAVHFDLPVMLAVALVLLPLVFAGRGIAQWEGVLLVSIYVAYVVYLVLAADQHRSLQPLSPPMLWFVLTLTAVWLLSLLSYQLGWRRRVRPQEQQRGPVDYLSSPLQARRAGGSETARR